MARHWYPKVTTLPSDRARKQGCRTHQDLVACSTSAWNWWPWARAIGPRAQW